MLHAPIARQSIALAALALAVHGGAASTLPDPPSAADVRIPREEADPIAFARRYLVTGRGPT
jgi:hypothetical protein